MGKERILIEEQKRELAALEAELAAGGLTAERLRAGATRLAAGTGRVIQDLLYLQTNRSSPASQVIGMLLIEEGETSEGALDADQWPSQTVLEAMRDGWRVVSFPNMALVALNHDDVHGLEFEFILERWR